MIKLYQAPQLFHETSLFTFECSEPITSNALKVFEALAIKRRIFIKFRQN